MKLLRKSRGKWIAIASGISIAASMLMVDYASAEIVTSAVDESQQVFATKEEVSDTDSVMISKMTEDPVVASEETPASEDLVVMEQQIAISEVTETWEANTVQSIQQEIERQEKLHLPEYVIQWGDTLSTIAVASNTTVDELVTLNQIENRDLIITGQLLKGVLKQQDLMNLAVSEPTLLERERQASYQKVTSTWIANTDSEIQQEIKRQESLGLPEYVIQWGDTLGKVAHASGTTINELAVLNHISDIDLIITGNTLKGVLRAASTPIIEQPVPPVVPIPDPEQPIPPVVPTPDPEQPVPPAVPTPDPEQPVPPVVPTPNPEQPVPPVVPIPDPEQPIPPVVPTPDPEQPIPPVVPIPKPEEPITYVPNTAPESEEKPEYRFEVRLEERREPIAIETEIIEDTSLPEGVEEISEGQAGVLIRTFEVVMGENDERLSEKEVKLERVAAVNRVIRRGKVVDRSRLQATITDANNKVETNYTNASWSKLAAILNEGVTLYGTQAITQHQADDMAERLTIAISELQRLKEKPILTVTETESDELQRSATLNYQLTDKDSAYLRSQVKVYRNGQLITTQSIENLQATIRNLDWDTVYEMESELIFDRGNGEESEILSSRVPVELQLKRIELKDIHEVALMKYTDGYLNRTLKLTGQEDASQYVVRIKSSNAKEMLLPVAAFHKEGTSVKVSVKLPQLVQREVNTHTFNEHFEFNVDAVMNESPITVEGKEFFTNFASLIAAMNANPMGHYILGADVSASELAANSHSTYVTEVFRGSLTAFFQGKQYTIYDLAKPLFRELNMANVSKVQLKEVAIQGKQNKAAALANSMIGSTVRDISVEGKITASHDVAGIVNEATSNSFIENVSFKGELFANTAAAHNIASNVGGIVGYMHNARLNKAMVDATITLIANNGGHRAGGLVGRADHQNSLITNSYAKGILNNAGAGGQIGGVVGSTWQSARVNNVVGQVKVVNGHTFFGDANYKNANVRNAYIVSGISEGKESLYAQSISAEEAQIRIREYDITIASQEENGLSLFDYSSIQGAQANREIAYRNTEKMLPFYNREFIVKQGNKIATTSKLATTALVSIVPMQDNRFITNYYGDINSINRLLLHFADGTVEYMSLNSGTQYRDSAVYEYQLSGTELLYTPNQFIQSTNQLLETLISEVQQMDYMDTLAKLFPDYSYPNSMIVSQKELMPNKQNTSSEDAVAKLKADRVDPLYLSSAFRKVQGNIQHYLQSLIAQSLIGSVTDTNQSSLNYLVDSIRTNKEQVMMSLAYIDRLYNIEFGDKNIGDLSLFRQDFLGKKVNVLDWLIQFGNSGQTTFEISRNYGTYGAHIGRVNGQYSVHDYLQAYRTRLTDQTASDWLKSATKAYIVEKTSQEPGLETAPVDVYHALTKNRHKYLLLPLLTLSQEGIYVISTMSGITFGMYDRYMDMNLINENPDEYANKVAELKVAIELEAERERRFFDMWYRLANDNVKNTLINRSDLPIPTWDGYRLNNNRGWMPSFGEKASISMLDFFGPINKWYRHNGSGAYAGGDYTHFVHEQVLSEYGHSIFTHEMTHNFDGSTFLGGYGRRKNAGAETYALGMLQSTTTATNQIFAWNMAMDYAVDNNKKNITNRVHNLHPDRFQNQADLQEYFKGMFDVLYTLDAIEGEAFLQQSDDRKRAIFKTLVLEKDANGEGKDRIRSFTDEEWQTLNFTTLADLVNNDVILALHNHYRDKVVGRNTYETTLMFVPIYGAITNDTGIAGNITFKRLAFDILAEKGYEGMLGYVSNKYSKEANNAGEVFSDKYVVNKIFDGQYADFKAFKLDMLTRRLNVAKAGQLREISFTYEGRNYTTTYENIKALIEQVAQQSPNKVQQVKEAIYRAYLLDTDDFRNSIYKSQP